MEASGHAGRLYDRLTQWFDASELFYDLENSTLDVNLAQRLIEGVDNAKVMLVLIGVDWLKEINRRAALSEIDFVRLEVERALQNCRHSPTATRVIPVLLGADAKPAMTELHPCLRATLEPLLALPAHTLYGTQGSWNQKILHLRDTIASVPGVAAPRFRFSADAGQIH
jgi:hypothetical protein